MKVLHVCETVKGGTATYLNELLPLLLLQKDKINLKLLIPREHIDQVPDIQTSCLICFFRPNRMIGLFFLFSSTLLTLIRFRPDIIHAHSTFAGVVVRLLGPLFGSKIIYCPHGWAMDREQLKITTAIITYIEKRLSCFSNTIVAISKHELQQGIAMGLPQNKMALVYNGVHAQEEQIAPAAWTDDKLRVLFIGRLDQQKGVDILLKASQGLDDHIDTKIIGEAVVGKIQLMETDIFHVELLGWKTQYEVYRYIAASDVVVIPSRWEGFGLVAIEAMRQEKPVIASDVGGLKEIVEHGVTGFLFPREDTEILSSILRQLDRATLKTMGLAGRKRFLEKFTAERMAAQIGTLYYQVYANEENKHEGVSS